nr:DUF2199 domain-containing protein [Pseudomonas aegrilactucae]
MCSQCSVDHPLEALELAYRRPDAAAQLTPAEREHSVQGSNDWCVIDGQRFFLRGVLPLALLEANDEYCIGAWVEVDPEAFERVCELWDEDGRDQAPFAARLANRIHGQADTLGLEARLQLSAPGQRPRIYLPADSHPLAVEQRDGITLHRAHEYSAQISQPA